jgi:photosystem II stability/assembly factor-like uncharacterized protein
MSKTRIKRSVIIAILLFIIGEAGYSQQAWKWQNPTPQGNNLSSVAIFNLQRIIAVGNSGTVVISNDSGNSWKSTSNVGKTNAALMSIFFDTINRKTWVVGDSGVILSSPDSGLTWERKTILQNNKPLSAKLYAVRFTSNNTGWIVGGDGINDGVILKTTNQGDSWQFQNGNVKKKLFACYFLNPLVGWVGCDSGIILKTTNGGSNWDKVITADTTSRSIYSIYFKDSNNGWLAGDAGLLQRTTDGGNSWTSIKSRTSFDITSFTFINSTQAVCIAQNAIIQSIDSGKTFVAKPAIDTTDGSHFFSALSVAKDQKTWYVVGDAGEIWQTTDGGASPWLRKTKGVTRSELRSLSSIDSLNVVAVGDKGTILLTTNGGAEWVSKSSGTTFPLYDVDFVTQNVIYTCGDRGIILKSTDKGDNWVPQISGVTNLIKKIEFFDEQHGFAICNSSFLPDTLLTTTDGGVTWMNRVLDSNYSLSAMYILNNNVGWIVGNLASRDTLSTSIIYKTTDAGNSWFTLNKSWNSVIYSIFFINEQIGWIAGSVQSILKTVDSGAHWQTQSIEIVYPVPAFFAMTMKDSLNGGVCGTNGVIYHTTNSGAYWFPQKSETRNTLNGIYFYDDSHGWVVGGNGTILWTDIGGGGPPLPPPPPPEIPEKIKLYPNYPNPFNPHVTGRTYFPFGLPQGNYLKKIMIYNLLGQQVKIIELNPPLDGGYVYDEKSENHQPPSWDGRDDGGRVVSSGIYFYRFVTSTQTITGKMIILR